MTSPKLRRRTAGVVMLVLVAVATTTVILQSASASGKAALAPTHGGTLRYAVDGEPTGFHPMFDACAQACQTISRTIFDPLLALDSKSNPAPYLAKSVTSNKTSTVWWIELRPGIKFSNGEKLDAAAVKANLDGYRNSAIYKGALASVLGVTVLNPLRVRVNLSAPWVRYDETLTGPGGWMIAPSTIADKNAGLHPIGTGPFVFKSWAQGQKLVVTRNARYWRAGLPYLNEIDFTPIADSAARSAALRQGQVDMLMTNDNQQISLLKKQKNINSFTTSYAAATDEFVLNNEVAPTNDLRVRKALAYSTDEAALIKVLGYGVVQKANGPFPPGNLGYQKQTIQPGFNLAKAQALVKSYQADKGPVKITLSVTPGDTVRGQLAQAMWQKAGIEVNLITKEATPQIIGLLTGTYSVAPGALPGAPDPAAQDIWWNSTNVNAIGKISLNYARVRDPIVDASLKALKENADPKVRRAAAQTITDRFAKGVYAIWNYWVSWGLAYQPKVHPNAVMTLPNGSPSAPYREGTNWLTETYITK
jgi:peptide/nickel transport system substrate-binding protein